MEFGMSAKRFKEVIFCPFVSSLNSKAIQNISIGLGLERNFAWLMNLSEFKTASQMMIYE
jgi:hypothetical protein